MGGHRASGAGDDIVDGPVDLAAVRADDALLDAIAGGSAPRGEQLGGYGGLGAGGHDDDQLAAVLAAWRADIEVDPMPELVTLDEATEAVDAGHQARDRRSSRLRRRMPFAIAAAAAVVAFAGFGVAVHGALPGDTLWSVSQVAFPTRADGIEKAQDAQVTIDAANAAIRRGDLATAKSLLQRADKQIGVLPPDVQPPLNVQQTQVSRALDPASRSGATGQTAPGATGSGTDTAPGAAGSASSQTVAPAAPSGPEVAPTGVSQAPTTGSGQTGTDGSDTTTPTTTTTTPAPPAGGSTPAN